MKQKVPCSHHALVGPLAPLECLHHATLSPPGGPEQREACETYRPSDLITPLEAPQPVAAPHGLAATFATWRSTYFRRWKKLPWQLPKRHTAALVNLHRFSHIWCLPQVLLWFFVRTPKKPPSFFSDSRRSTKRNKNCNQRSKHWQKSLCFYASLYRGFQVANWPWHPDSFSGLARTVPGVWFVAQWCAECSQSAAPSGGKASQLDGMFGMLMNSLVFPLDEFLVTWIDTVFNSLIQNQTPKKQWHFLSRCAITSNNQPGLSKSTINKSDVLQLPITTLHFNSQPLPGQRPHWPVHDHSVAAWIICCSSPSLPVRCRWWTSEIEMLVLQKYIIPLTKRSYYTRLCDYSIYILYTVYTTIISSRKKTVIFNNPNDSLLLSLLTWTQNECEHKTIPFQTWSEVTHVHLFEELLWERIGLTVVGVNHRFAWEKLLP